MVLICKYSTFQRKTRRSWKEATEERRTVYYGDGSFIDGYTRRIEKDVVKIIMHLNLKKSSEKLHLTSRQAWASLSLLCTFIARSIFLLFVEVKKCGCFVRTLNARRFTRRMEKRSKQKSIKSKLLEEKKKKSLKLMSKKCGSRQPSWTRREKITTER